MDKETKQHNNSIYKSLCICSPEFAKIPINRRDLGMTVEVSSYTFV